MDKQEFSEAFLLQLTAHAGDHTPKEMFLDWCETSAKQNDMSVREVEGNEVMRTLRKHEIDTIKNKYGEEICSDFSSALKLLLLQMREQPGNWLWDVAETVIPELHSNELPVQSMLIPHADGSPGGSKIIVGGGRDIIEDITMALDEKTPNYLSEYTFNIIETSAPAAYISTVELAAVHAQGIISQCDILNSRGSDLSVDKEYHVMLPEAMLSYYLSRK